MNTSSSQVLAPDSYSPRVEERRRRVLAYIAEHSTMTVATHGPEGVWASTLFYANVGFDLYFRSKPSTRHVRDILASPQVAATIHRDARDWVAVQGIQLEGVVSGVVDGDEGLEVMRRFVGRFPLVDTLWGLDEDSAELWTSDRAARSLFRLRPSRIRFHDHEYDNRPADLSQPELRLGPLPAQREPKVPK